MQNARLTSKTSSLRLIWRMVLASVLSVALLLVGFGHRPAQAEPQMTAYLLAGGDWADLCGDGRAPHPAADLCSACILAKGMTLTSSAAAPYAMLSEERLTWTLRAASPHDRASATIYAARAPPFDDRSTLL